MQGHTIKAYSHNGMYQYHVNGKPTGIAAEPITATINIASVAELLGLRGKFVEIRGDCIYVICGDRLRYHVCADMENNADTWWEAARGSVSSCPKFAREFIMGTSDHAETEKSNALKRFYQWCQSLPGWNDGPAHAPRPILVFIMEYPTNRKEPNQ